MNIKFTTRNLSFSGALKGFVEKHLEGIEKISGDIIEAEVIASQEKLDYKVEIIMKSRLHSYHTQGKDPILKQAVRGVLDTLKVQAKKNKDKYILKRSKGSTKLAAEIELAREERALPKDRAANSVTISSNFSKKPLSVEEAIFFLKESGENAYMFTNAETNKISVVFNNKKNAISIIEEMM